MSRYVHIVETGERFVVDPDESILDAAFKAGVKMAHECQFGGCATCRVKVLDGTVRYDEFPMALTESEAEGGFALACQARLDSDVTISTLGGLADFPAPRVLDGVVAGMEAVTADICQLTLRLDTVGPLAYIPGQYMNIVLPHGVTRSFSMARAAADSNVVEFHVRRVPDGFFTDRMLGDMRPGDPVRVDIPHGTFCYRDKDWRPLVMAATGTGIAPIKAILESLLDNDECPPVALYWGMRTEEDLYLRDHIESWKGRLCEFEFVPVLSRAGESWRGRRGYVQDAIAQDFPDLSEHAVYLCGSPSMIADAQRLLPKCGAQPDYIYADSFTFQNPVALTA